MTNFEKHKEFFDACQATLASGIGFGVDVNDDPFICNNDCDHCKFMSSVNCVCSRFEWLSKEE